MNTRSEIARYAQRTCIAALEQAAARRVSGAVPEVIDHVGYGPTMLEEALRPFWGLAPLMRDGVDLRMQVGGHSVPVGEWLRGVLVDGVTPGTPGYWDAQRDAAGAFMLDFQNITEVAGLMVGMYFAPQQTWALLTPDEQRRVADWIYGACRPLCAHIAGNNHIWFPLLCLLVLQRFGYTFPETDAWLAEGLAKLDEMYISNGWYADGDFGRFDYYEAWSMHTYPLLWCLIADESTPGYAARRAVYLHRTERFLQDYVCFFDVHGAHVPFGRSLAYRFAASCVFPLAVLAGAEIDPALAKTVTVRNISYFADRVQCRTPNLLPPGYLYEAPALVENYTSDGGAYWCAKTFLCLLMDESHPFWASEPVPLPADGAPYMMRPADPQIHLTVTGDAAHGVTLLNNVCQYYQHGRYCNPFNDMAGYYCKFAYNSLAGFALSTRDCTACDNMISLTTPDESMHSHRWGFTDLGEADGWMASVHTPFGNDPATVIHTWMRPLHGSVHVRVHRIVLRQPYRVTEGGYPVPMWDDRRTYGGDDRLYFVAAHGLYSRIAAAATFPLQCMMVSAQPGMHLLAPRAVIPAYGSAVLTPGVYWAAVVCGVSEDGAETLPTVRIADGAVTVDGTDVRLDCARMEANLR